MYFRKLSLTGLLIGLSQNLFALGLHHYDIRKTSSDPYPATIHVGKEYFFEVRGLDQNSNPPTSGIQDLLGLSCAAPCQMQIIAPAPASGSFYLPDPNGAVPFILRFDSPGNFTIHSQNRSDATVTGDMNITVESMPTQFAVSAPIATVAGNQINVTLTALNSNGSTVVSFYDTVNIYDQILGLNNTVTVFAASFVNGVATGRITVTAGDANTRNNKVIAQNSLTYFGQGAAAMGTSNDIQVTPTTYMGLVQLFPGEVLTPGFAGGKNSSGIQVQTSNVPVSVVKVFAVDTYYNPMTGAQLSGLGLSTSFTSNVAAGDTLPPSTGMTNNPTQFFNAFIFSTANQVRNIRATPSNGTADVSIVSVTAGPIGSYEIFVQPASGANFKTNDSLVVKIRALDALGNVNLSVNDVYTNPGPPEVRGLTLQYTGNPGFSGAQYVDSDPSTDSNDNTIQFVNGIATLNISITRPSSNGVSLRFTDNAGLTVNSNVWNIAKGDVSRVVFTIKGVGGQAGQSFVEGVYPFNTGTPPTIDAGDQVNIEARLTDKYGNIFTGFGTDQTSVQIAPQDSSHNTFSNPTSQQFPAFGELQGGQSFHVTFYTADTQTILGTTSGIINGIASQSQQITVRPRPYSKLALVGPGQSLGAGFSTVNGAVNSQSAGVPFQVQAYAVDDFFNPTAQPALPSLTFQLQDPAGIVQGALPRLMSGSMETFTMTLGTPGFPLVTVKDANNTSIQSSISVLLGAGNVDHFEITPPVASPQEAGIGISLVIRAKDRFDNTVSVASTLDISVEGTIPNTNNRQVNPAAVTPRTLTLGANGQFTGTIAVLAAIPQLRIKVSDRSNPNVIGRTNRFDVNPSAQGYKKLVLIMPGEDIDPGVGKLGSASQQIAGIILNPQPRALACDPYFNPIDVGGTPHRIQFASDKYFTATFNPSSWQTNQAGTKESSTPMTLRTANTGNILASGYTPNATHSVSVTDLDNTSTSDPAWSASPVLVLPGSYKKIMMILPGQLPDPGINNVTGKSVATVTAQQTSLPFDSTILAVDDSWNRVDYTGGDVVLDAPTAVGSVIFRPLNSTDPNSGGVLRPFANGIQTRQVIFGREGHPHTIIAVDNTALTRPSQSVDVDVAPGPSYRIVTPPTVTAGQPISIEVHLVDATGTDITGYGQTVYFSAAFPTGSPSRGNFNAQQSGYAMNNGMVTVNLTYQYVETIQAKITDDFGRVAYSNNIIVQPSGLEYSITAPPNATVGLPQTFPITVRLRDLTTHTDVLNYDHAMTINVVSAQGNANPGQFSVNQANLTSGLVTFQQSYTKAEPIILEISRTTPDPVPAFNPAITRTGVINMTSDGYKQLMVISQGETHMPGVPSATGKTGTPLPRQVGQPFLLQVRAVDQFWNISNNTGGGKILFVSDDNPASLNATNPSNNQGPLVNGELAASVKLFRPRDTKVTVSDSDNAGIGSQSVTIPIGGLYYLVTVPDPSLTTFSGPPSTFGMDITLLDSITNLPVTTANNPITIQALQVSDGQVAAGNIGRTSGVLVNGHLSITNQSYSIAETVFFRVNSDASADIQALGDSIPVRFMPRQITYAFDTPAKGTVNTPFHVTIRTIDFDTSNPVKNLTRSNIQLSARQAGGLALSGTLTPNSINLIDGRGDVDLFYDKAESIFLVLTDNTSPTVPGFPTQPVWSSGNITIEPGPLAALDGDITEMLATETPTITFIAKDRFGNINPDQTLVFTVTSIDLPGVMFLNGQQNLLMGKTNSLGEFIVRFAAPQAFGNVQIEIKDGDHPGNSFRKYLTINVKGIPFGGARALGLGEERIPVGSSFRLPVEAIEERLVRAGATMRLYYRLDNGPYQLYDKNTGAVGFDKTQTYQVEYYFVACYDSACSSPISQLDIQGAPTLAQVTTYTLAGKLTGYPSPFNPTKDAYMTLQYPMSTDSSVRIIIYDLFGHKVREISVDAGQNGGQAREDNRVFWDGTNDAGQRVSNGNYIVVVDAPGQKMRQKVVVRN